MSVAEKLPYKAPSLRCFGNIKALTMAGATGSSEGSMSGSMNMATSDRRAKDNIVEIGRHPLGFGLYLFDYRPELKATFGDGRQFGVMADEVEFVKPDAVTIGPNGYKQVDYNKLGIEQTVN